MNMSLLGNSAYSNNQEGDNRKLNQPLLLMGVVEMTSTQKGCLV